MGENLIITKRNGNRVPLQSRHMATAVMSARQTWVLNGDDTVDITVQSPYPQTYDIGDKITVFGRDYTLNRLSKPKKSGAHEFQYTLQFEGVQYDLLRATYDVTIDTTNNNLQDVQGDSLTGNLHRFLTVLIANANRVFPGKWRLGACPDTASDVTLTFGESDNCLSVLQSLMGKFGESLFFDIAVDGSVYVLNILSASRTLPFTLEFGKNKGLYMISRDNVSSANIVTRLKVYGSASNITSKYRADRLCLPGKTKAQSYIEKPEAVAKYGIFEGRKHFDNIKPTFTGHVQAVGDSVLELIDPTISFDLNAKEADGVTTKYLLNGVAAKVHFNTGNLAGYEFEIAKYDHATHKITLRKFTDDRGDVFPSETSAAFQFATGNEYKIVDITLPPELISAAENELLETGTKFYEQNSQPKVQYSVSVTKAYIEKHFATDAGIVNVFVPGDYVPIKDPDIDVDKAIRIKSITRNVLDPYEYNLTISDTVTSNITNRVISDIIDIDKVLEVNNLKDPARARANWRSSREVLDMVFDPEGDYYTDKIKPNSIDTLALSVGAKSMQFGLSNTIFMPNYNGNVNILKWKGGILSHYAISDDGVKSWIIQDGQITLNDSSKPYYIYAKCNRNGENGTFDITTVQHKVEESTEFYYFWVGIVNSVDSETNVRTLSLMYGFTTINGRYIKTGRIESSGDGKSYFDLDSNEFALGDALIFNRNQSRKLLLNGVFVQSQGGTEFPLPCYRGEWQMNVAYFVGDTVSYAVNGKYSLYQCYKDCKGIVPTNSTYWAIQASAGSDGKDGKDGVNGDWTSYVFKKSNTQPATPTSDKIIPDGWSDAPTASGKWWMSKATINGLTGKAGTWSAPVQTTAEDGVDGCYTDFKYRKNTSKTVKPDIAKSVRNPANWNDEPPTLGDGEYLWMSQAEINADNTLKGQWSDPVRISGEDGKDGVNGNDGTPGNYTEFRFAKNGSTTVPPTVIIKVGAVFPENYSVEEPTIGVAEYLWMIHATISGDKKTLVSPWSNPIRVTPRDGSNGQNGVDGAPGDDGVGISSVTNFYARSSSGTTAPTAWSTTPPTLTSILRFLWNYERITYTNGTHNDTAAHVIGVYGATGQQGNPGVGIKTITEYYLATTASSGVTRQTSGWTTSIQAINATKKYLWNYECVEFTDNTFHYTDPVLIGVYGDKGDKGDKGESPALVFRGDYSPSKVYYGTTSRLDCVKYGNAYYIARIDAGTFSNIVPTNTAKWNAFGSSFESVATGLLLAENANIANLIFRNQRLESSAKTNGIPNFFLDGLKNIASFAAGNVVFDGASATLGWLSVVGRELLGFDDDGVQRLRLTPNALPTVSSASSRTDLVVKSSGGDATFTGETDWEVSFEQAIHCYYGRDDMTDDIDMDFYGWVEFDIAEDNTLVDLSDIQFSCSVKPTGSSKYNYLQCSMSAYVQRKVGSSWENIGSVSLNGVNAKITIPKAGRIRISFNGSVSESVGYDCSGTFTMATQAIQALTAKTEMIIAKDGFMAIYNSNYMRMHSTDGLIVKFGNYYFRVNSSGIAKSTNGTSWTNL